MTLVGKHYNKEHYNCANFVAEWYDIHLGIKIPVINAFDRSFLVWMRKHFTKADQPSDHCLVLMTNIDGSYHVGVYHDYGVYHNFKPSQNPGSVCKWTLGSVENYYTNVSFYTWLQ